MKSSNNSHCWVPISRCQKVVIMLVSTLINGLDWLLTALLLQLKNTLEEVWYWLSPTVQNWLAGTIPPGSSAPKHDRPKRWLNAHWLHILQLIEEHAQVEMHLDWHYEFRYVFSLSMGLLFTTILAGLNQWANFWYEYYLKIAVWLQFVLYGIITCLWHHVLMEMHNQYMGKLSRIWYPPLLGAGGLDMSHISHATKLERYWKCTDHNIQDKGVFSDV